MVDPKLLVQSGSPENRVLNSSSRTKQLDREVGCQSAYPVRTCLGCGTRVHKAELVRLVVSAGVLVADRMKVLPGRGVYCCRNAQCYQRLLKQRKKLVWAMRYHGTDKGENLVISPALDAEFSTHLL